MIKYICVLLSVFLILSANPQIITMINEFQTTASGNDVVEFHNTWGIDYQLLNVPVTTIAGTALIDTNIILGYDDYPIIDDPVLNGPFYLPPDSGFIIVYVDYWFRDSIFYPFYDSVPSATASASKFYRWAGFDLMDEYLVEDWYIDYSPTLGLPNDDYPGCKVSGTVRYGDDPIPNATVVAASVDTIRVNPESLFLHQTTYTVHDGSFSFEYLFPVNYVITASAAGYGSCTDTTPMLHALQPLTGFDFDLNSSAIDVSRDPGRIVSLKISANPFREDVNIVLNTTAGYENYAVKIFDISCRLVRKLPIQSGGICWNGRDEHGEPVSPGIYFMLLPDSKIKLIKL